MDSDVTASPDPLRPARTRAHPLGEVADRAGTTLDAAGMAVSPHAGTPVTGVTLDSRRICPGDLYAALPGANVHGARFAEQAQAAGAVAVLTDPAGAAQIASETSASIPVLVVPEPRSVLGDLASWVYGDPSHHLAVIGITGTNGKTTTAYLMDAALRAVGHTTGLIGTVETRVAGRAVPSARTTPEAPDLQALFARMLEEGVTAAVIEVSSHSLVLHRVDGTRFAVSAFTNLSQDHLDFHGSLEDYYAAKSMLFDGRAARDVVVVDDEWGRRLVRPTTTTVSTRDDVAAAWRASDVRDSPTGVSFTLAGPGLAARRVALQIPGRFNAANAALAIAALAGIGVDPEGAVRGVESLPAIPGRVERVDAGQDYLAVVDYAHTPDAVASLLGALGPVTTGRMITVLGCGGDRDPDKRPLMGEAAARGSDLVIVTDDNPRSEPPESIRAAVLAGARSAAAEVGSQVREVANRSVAIREAVAQARPGDAVVIAGKGHEQGQEVAGTVHPFDDRRELRAAICAALDLPEPAGSHPTDEEQSP